jgi:hypothetical protein
VRQAVDYYWPGTLAGDGLPVRGTAFYDAPTPLDAWKEHERRLLRFDGRDGVGPAEEIVLRACVAEDRQELPTIERMIRAEGLR